MNIRSYGERPARKHAVKDELEQASFVKHVGDMGAAVIVTTPCETVSTFGKFIKGFGWVPVSVYERNGERYITFAPVDGVMDT